MYEHMFCLLVFCETEPPPRLFGPITCLSHKDEGIVSSALPKGTTSELARFFSHSFVHSSMRKVVNNIFKAFGITRHGN